MSYLFKDYVKTLSGRLQTELATIMVEHNFDYGPEFEIALCTLLREALPQTYGVARGFVVDMDGVTAGDDIVVFERSRYPSLGLRTVDDFSRKEFIPIQATYAYIEAKHTIHIHGSGGQSLERATTQVADAKRLCSARQPVEPELIAPYLTLKGVIEATTGVGFPNTKNPSYGIIFARNVALHKGGDPMTDPEDIVAAVRETGLIGTDYPPDLIVLGNDNIVFPVIDSDDERLVLHSPFFIPGESRLTHRTVNGIAPGLALAFLMFALDWIDLGKMPWINIIANGLGLDRPADPAG